VNRIPLPHNTEQWQTIANTVMRLRVPRKVHNLAVTCAASQE
jgi:hypothetical protein